MTIPTKPASVDLLAALQKSVTAARESARESNGEFGTQPRADVSATVDLAPATDPTIHGGPDDVADALRAGGFDGPIQVHRPGYVTYTDTDYANNYDVDFGGDGLLVRSEDTDALVYSHRFASSQPLQPAAVCRELHNVMNEAHDIRSMGAALAEWSSTSKDDRGYGWTEPEFDPGAGTMRVPGFTIGGFARGDRNMPEMVVTLDANDGDNEVEFTYQRQRDGSLYVMRGDGATPLALWETRALDTHVEMLMNRSDSTRSLSDLFDNACRKANR